MAQHPLGGGSCVEFCKQLYRKLCQFHSTTPPNLVYGRWLVLIGIIWFAVFGFVVPDIILPAQFDKLLDARILWTKAVRGLLASATGCSD
jgi:hypothetical protein